MHLDRKKAIALLAYLAMSGRTEERATLATVFWPDQDRARSLGSLRRALRTLTEAIGTRSFAVTRTSIGLRQEPDLWVDATQFEKLAGRKPNRGESEEATWRAALPDLERAASLYRDDFLAGFTLRDSEAFDEWQFFQTERLRNLLSETLEALVEGWQTLGQHDQAIAWAQRWLSHDLLAEEVHRTLMKLYAASGRRSEALRQYEKCTEILAEQLQVEPELETQQLYSRIRGGAAHVPPPSPPPERRRPERLDNLPDPPTALVGRAAELSTVAKLLSDPQCRLLTLIGPGGIGKTRLALEAARCNSEGFAHGACFVSFAASTSSRVVGAITETLRLALDPQGDEESQLLSYLADKKALLVFDNFEHILDKSPLVSAILLQAPGVKIIATSRARLNIQGEWLLEIKGLDFPEEGVEGDIEGYPAVELFLQAARRVETGFRLSEGDREAVIQICGVLGGMPLGIELAAAWLRLIPCRDIAAGIQDNLDFLASNVRDLPERHRSLRAVFDSSANLLSRDERAALLGLSVFRGGFSLEAAAQVASATLPDLVSLVDKSLISRTVNRRCQMHELIRQFALELLEARSELLTAVRSRHSAYYLGLLASQEESLRSGRQREAVEELFPDIDNIRAAWQWAVDHHEESSIEKTLESIDRFCLLANWFAEGEQMLEAAAQSIPQERSPLLWAKIATRQSRFCIRLWRYRKATDLLEECLAVFRRLEDEREEAFTLASLSVVYFHLGEFDKAADLATECVDIWRRIGDPHGTADSLMQLGRVAAVVGRLDDAMRLLTESHDIFKKLGDQNGMGRCLSNLGAVAYICRDHRESIRLFEEGLERLHPLGDRRGMAFCLSNLGLVYEDLGEHEKAKKMSQQALDLFMEIGYQKGTPRARRGHAGALENLGRATFGLGEYEESRKHFTESLRTALEIHEAPQALLALMGLARLFAHYGNSSKAWELLTFASRHSSVNSEIKLMAKNLRNDIRPPLPPKKRAEAEARAAARTLESISEHAMSLLEATSEESPRAIPLAN